MVRDPEYVRFVIKNAIRGIVYFGLIVGIFFIAKYWLPENWNAILAPVTSNPKLVYLIFFLSETFFGIIPPEFFVIWALKSSLEIFILKVALFSIISFTGALIAYYAGSKIHDGGLYQKIIKSRFNKYVGYYHRYGGALIILSAVTPLPFATISLISGALGFKFKKYFWFASTRFLRFIFYGFFFWEIQ